MWVQPAPENIIQRARERTSGFIRMYAELSTRAPGASIVLNESRQAKELANMFVAWPNIRPVCAGSVQRSATSLDHTGISFRTVRDLDRCGLSTRMLEWHSFDCHLLAREREKEGGGRGGSSGYATG